MGRQRFEYTSVKITHKNISGGDDIGSLLNGYSEDGWRLVETFEYSGSTMHLILERPAE